MRQAATMRWIEQREARQMLAGASFERPAPSGRTRYRRRATVKALAELRQRLASWFVIPAPALPLAQPVLIRRTVGLGERRRSEDNYRRNW